MFQETFVIHINTEEKLSPEEVLHLRDYLGKRVEGKDVIAPAFLRTASGTVHYVEPSTAKPKTLKKGRS